MNFAPSLSSFLRNLVSGRNQVSCETLFRRSTKAGALRLLALAVLGLWACLLATGAAPAPTPTPTQPGPATPVPTLDRLAIPTLPANPSQVDKGLVVYYYHCMPCHGDRGQGLTDEWRAAWEEDHQNCWGSGCHGGREKDEGFPIPKVVPSVLGLAKFPTPQDLFAYLQTTHPPQRPGALTADEYWSVAAYILFLAGRLPAGEQIGPGAPAPAATLEIPAPTLQPTSPPAPASAPTPSRESLAALLAIALALLIVSMLIILGVRLLK